MSQGLLAFCYTTGPNALQETLMYKQIEQEIMQINMSFQCDAAIVRCSVLRNACKLLKAARIIEIADISGLGHLINRGWLNTAFQRSS
jgi:hypothetical protein